MIINFLIALILLLVALAIISFVFIILGSQFSNNGFQFYQNFRLRRQTKLLNQADELIKNEKFREATQVLRSALILDKSSLGNLWIERVHQHNLAVLSRMVSIGDHFLSHLISLPIVEELITNRTEMLKAYSESNSANKKFKKKVESKDKEKYKWALNEFSSKIGELEERLKANKKAVLLNVDHLIDQLFSTPSSTEVTYH